MIKQILKFFNSIQLHYGKLNSVNERDIKLIDEEALIKLSIKHGSVEKIFEYLILKYEKGVDINEEYINKVFSEYKIDIDQANSLISKLKQPKEPSFSKKALLKTPDFSKTKFEEITKPSFSNIPKSQNKIENDKVNDNSKNTDIKKNKTLKEHWNSWNNGQKIGYVVLCIIIFGVFSNIFSSSSTSKSISNTNKSSNKCVGLDATGNYMGKVISIIENQGCGISGYYFVGRGSYIVNSICPELDRARGRIGSIDIEVVVNKCGEIIKVNF